MSKSKKFGISLRWLTPAWLGVCVALMLPWQLSSAQNLQGLLGVDGQQLQRTDAHFVWMWRHVNLQIATARRVCSLSQSQQAKFSQFDPNWLHEFLFKNDRSLAGGNPDGFAVQEVISDGKTIQIAFKGRSVEAYVKDASVLLDSEIHAILIDSQREAFDRIVCERKKFRAETLALVIVNNIERRVYLDSQRRPELIDDLVTWALEHDLHSPFYVSYPQYLPSVPQTIFESYFDAGQLKQIAALQRIKAEAVQYESQMFQHESAIVFEESQDGIRRSVGGKK